jgi:hypothetical protein
MPHSDGLGLMYVNFLVKFSDAFIVRSVTHRGLIQPIFAFISIRVLGSEFQEMINQPKKLNAVSYKK